jgi:hypothetical protein
VLVGEEEPGALEGWGSVGAVPGLLQVHCHAVAAAEDPAGDLAALPVQEDPAALDGAPGLSAGDAAAGGDEAIDALAVVGGAGVEREALHQASADGQPAQPAPRGASQAGAFFRWSVAWKPEPFNAKALALITFLAGDPQASCFRSGAADTFWSVSKRPHRGQSYS